MGRQQVSHLSHEESVQWLDWLVQGLGPDTKPFLSLVVMRKLLRIALQALGLDSLMLTLASLRCGGATQLLRLTQNVPLIQHFGRWKHPESLAHYLQESMSVLVQQSIPLESQLLIDWIKRDLSLLDQVPRQPWLTFFRRPVKHVDLASALFSVHGPAAWVQCGRVLDVRWEDQVRTWEVHLGLAVSGCLDPRERVRHRSVEAAARRGPTVSGSAEGLHQGAGGCERLGRAGSLRRVAGRQQQQVSRSGVVTQDDNAVCCRGSPLSRSRPVQREDSGSEDSSDDSWCLGPKRGGGRRRRRDHR